jgi:branched-chain amino acid transport system permease protein
MMNLGMSFGPSILVAVAFAALIGALLAVPAARLSGLAFAFITFGLGIVTQALLAGQLLNQWTMGGSGLFTPIVSIFGNTLQGSNLYYFAFALLILCMTIYGNLVNSRSGRALSTLKESEPVALALGIPVQRYKMWSFALGAAFAGLSGVLLSQVNQFSSPDSFTLTTSITLMAMLILGGTRSMIGPLVGAAFFVLLPEFLHGVQDNAPIVFSAILLIMLIIAPQGLVGVFRNLVRRYSGGTGADPPPVPREGPGEIGPADVVSR